MKNFLDNIVILFSTVKARPKLCLTLLVTLFTAVAWGWFAAPVLAKCVIADIKLGATETKYVVWTNSCGAIAGYNAEGEPILRSVEKMLGVTTDDSEDTDLGQ